MALFGSIPVLRAQADSLGLFAPAFAYLDELFRPGSIAGQRLEAISIGETHRVELAEGSFALEQVYRSKTRPEGFFESHRNYIDVQVIFTGAEWMEVIGIDQLKVREPYNPTRDLLIYQDVAGASLLHVTRDHAAIFYPEDGHMPGLSGPEPAALVRKTVIKVPVRS
jgi:YhcH/YjgK/YiaL family protein